MTAALTIEELLGWSDQTTRNWFAFLAKHPALQATPCGIYGTANVLGLVRHMVAVEIRYSQRLAGLPVADYETFPEDSLGALVALHDEAVTRLRGLLADPAQNWDEELEFKTLTAGTLRATRRKIVGHAVLHSIRHWAQVATLARAAGTAPDFDGDLLLSSSLR
jgi:uncharacterized damage-inducible protein DinB